jgi:O-antigen/teichoic acid export membrane protein
MRRLAADTAFSGSSYVVAAAAQLTLQVFAARTTEVAHFGRYAAAFAFVSAIQVIFLGRSSELALQFLGRAWVEKNLREARLIWRRLRRQDRFFNSILYLIIALLALALPRRLGLEPAYVVALALLIPGDSGFGPAKALFISTGRIRQQALFEVCYSLGQLIAGVAGVAMFGIPGLIGALVVSSWVKTAVAMHIAQRWLGTADVDETFEDDSYNRAEWRSFIAHSVLRNAFASGASQGDILIVNALQGPTSVALYKVAKTLASLPVQAAGPLWAALRPRILHAWHSRDRGRVLRLIALPATFLFLGMVIGFVPVTLFRASIIQAVYGSRFADAADPFLYLLAGSWIFGAVTGWYSFVVLLSDKKRRSTILYAALFAIVCAGGFTVGRHSATAMARVLLFASLFVSIGCWAVLWIDLRDMSESDPSGVSSDSIAAE